MNDQRIIKTLDIFRLEMMGLAVQMCEREPDEKILKLLPNRNFNDSVYQTMSEILPEFNETIVLCNLFDNWTKCVDIVYPTLSEKEICYSFNTISLMEYVTNE